MRLPCAPLISNAAIGLPSSTKDNDSSTSAPGCGATAIWNSNVVGALMSTSSSALTCRFIRLMLFADPCWVPGPSDPFVPSHIGFPDEEFGSVKPAGRSGCAVSEQQRQNVRLRVQIEQPRAGHPLPKQRFTCVPRRAVQQIRWLWGNCFPVAINLCRCRIGQRRVAVFIDSAFRSIRPFTEPVLPDFI